MKDDFLAYWHDPEGWLMLPPGSAASYSEEPVRDLHGHEYSIFEILPTPKFTLFLRTEPETFITGIMQIFGRITTQAGQVFVNADLRAYTAPVQIELENTDQPGDK